MLAAVVVGGAAGAVVGRFADHKLKGQLQEKIGSALAAGSAVFIGVFPADRRLVVEQSLAGSPMKSVVESDEKGLKELQSALAEAMAGVSSDHN